MFVGISIGHLLGGGASVEKTNSKRILINNIKRSEKNEF